MYDLERLACAAPEIVHDVPADEWRRIQRAEGYRWVLVDGQVTIDDDVETHRYSGRLLRSDEGRGTGAGGPA